MKKIYSILPGIVAFLKTISWKNTTISSKNLGWYFFISSLYQLVITIGRYFLSLPGTYKMPKRRKSSISGVRSMGRVFKRQALVFSIFFSVFFGSYLLRWKKRIVSGLLQSLMIYFLFF
jgi:hypothetical protein